MERETAEALRPALQAVLEEDPSGLETVVLRGGRIDDPELEVARYDVTADLGRRMRTGLVEQARALLDREFLPYDPAYRTSAAQALVEDLAAAGELASVDARVRRGDLPLDDSPRPVLAMVYALGSGEDRLVGYRFSGPGIATRRRGGLQLLPREGRYEEVRGEILVHQDRLDAWTFRGAVAFTSVSTLGTHLQETTRARALARRTVERVRRQVRIEGGDQLAEAAQAQPAMRSKLASIARLLDEDREYAALLTTERLVAFVRDNPHSGVALAEVGGETVLRFDPAPAGRFKILNLLADDFLQSALTGRHYEAGSKARTDG